MKSLAGHTVRVRQLVAIMAAAGATLGTVACGSSGSTAPKTGSLTVTITAPTGVTPNVTVSGPGGYSKVLSATATLTGLGAGNYAVTAAPVTTTGPIVGTVNTGSVSGSPATVVAGTTAAATATYAQRPGSGGLWIANDGLNHTTVQYSAAQLASTTSAAPAIAIGTGAANNVGVAFDANGNLWVTFFNGGVVALQEYTASQLNASGTPTPAVTLSANAASNQPVALAFDASGNAWVLNSGTNTVVEYTANQLASSGSPTPAVTISPPGGSLADPEGIVFDASGNLWVSNSSSTLVEFTPSQLTATGAPTPNVTLTSVSTMYGPSINGPLGLAFDATGNLWVANGDFSTYTVVAFSPGQLTATGSPIPIITLSANAGSLNAPGGLAFDASGDLWVSNLGNSVVEFAASQIVTSSSPTPNITITGSSLSQPFGMAFDPPAANLPLKP